MTLARCTLTINTMPYALIDTELLVNELIAVLQKHGAVIDLDNAVVPQYSRRPRIKTRFTKWRVLVNPSRPTTETNKPVEKPHDC